MQQGTYEIELNDIIKRFDLEKLFVSNKIDEIKVQNPDINRPGLQIAGFFDYFDTDRIQILGRVEHTYLQKLSAEDRFERISNLFSTMVPAIIITRSQEIFPEMLELAQKHDVTLLRTSYSTSPFMSALIAYLNNVLAPRITRHGVLVEVYGEGILILGESGVGKSETAVELVKRGHRLVADDAVEIKKVSAISLVGSAPEIIRHFIEIRGIGIIDVKKIFGIGAVKDTEKIDLIIQLEAWEDGKQYDRLGLVDEHMNILDIEVPSLLVPVKPGRNLAIIMEIAAMNNRQKRMGYNAAEELNKRLMSEMEKSEFGGASI